jgi:hypothetical protein
MKERIRIMKYEKLTMILLPALVFLLALPAMASDRSSVTVTLDRAALVNGKQIPAGDYRVTFQRETGETPVTFTNEKNDEMIKTTGTIVDRKDKSEYNALLTEKEANGKNVVKEIRLRGKKEVLVFE